MSIVRVNELPDGSGSLTNDDVFLFMDDPSGSGITKKISLTEISAAIGGGGGGGGGSGLNFEITTVDLHNGGLQNAQVLKFTNNNYQSVITGPTPPSGNNSQRIIVQGQRAQGNGEGGDVYVWGGDSDVNGGDIKIYAGDADNISSGQGGYVNIDGGNGYDQGGNIGITAGNSTLQGGNITISAGFPSGNVTVSSDGGNYDWTFDNDGTLVIPQGKPINWGQNIDTLGPPIAGGGTDRVRLWDFQGGGSNFNYAIGAEGNHVWFAMDVNNGTGGFKFYSRDNEIFKISDDSKLIFPNNTIITPGTFDNGTGGNSGISLICAVGYELNWQGGHLKSTADNGVTSSNILCDSPIEFTGIGSGVKIDNSGISFTDGTTLNSANHTHSSSNISNFNSTVSGLLPVKNIVSGTGISISSTTGVFTVSSTGSGVYSDQSSSVVTTVFNNTANTINKGSVVYINGGQGDQPTINLAIATNESGSSKTYGITYENITSMSSGKVVVLGALTGFNTDQFNPTAPTGDVNGTILYLSPSVSGAMTTTKPLSPNHLVSVGTIVRTHQNAGIIEVRIQNGFELGELHNVSTNGSGDNGKFLQYNSASGLWLSSSSGNFTTLQLNGTTVSVSGHTHTSADITNFNSSVSGLLPTISNSGDNRILTSTGSTVGVNAESNATFDGTNLNVTGVFNIDNLRLDLNTISSTNSNGNIILAPNGTGDVYVDADTLRVGDSNTAATITTNGAGSLTINTNGGTNSGTIVINQGSDGNIAITPNGVGEVDLSKVDIDGGSIDGTAIGGTTASTGKFTQLYPTVLDNGNVSGSVGTDVSTGQIFDMVITGSTTLSNPTNSVNGVTIRWRITQDGTGGHAMSLDTKFVIPSSASNPLPWSTAPNTMDILAATYHAGRDKWDIIAFVPGY